MSDDGAIVLAAGRGTRMRSTLPKVLHPVAGKPMLVRVLEALDGAGLPDPAVVVGYGSDLIRAAAGDRCRYVEQPEQLGTGDAARIGLAALDQSIRRVLLVHGDEPLVPAEIYRQMLAVQAESGAPVLLLTARVGDTRGFGRVVRDPGGNPTALVQEIELSNEQRALNEVNLGAYVFDVRFLREQLDRLQPHAPKGEYYLTDLIAIAAAAGHRVAAITPPDGAEMMGVNDLVQLEAATRMIYRRTNRRLMESGVTIVDGTGTYIDEDAEIEPDTLIHPFTIIGGRSRIGRGCVIGPSSHIRDTRIGAGSRIVSSTVEASTLGDAVQVGPYAHLGPGVEIESGVTIGSHSQIKRSSIGAGSRMHHFGYVGDARVGRNVNIGAGVVTCNFDGHAKHRTVIEDGAFIGSDTMLRAPVTVGEGGSTGAGAVVIHDVAPGTVVAGIPARVIGKAPETAHSDGSGDQAEAEAQARSGV
ncbi:MAG TPA: bifunctional UDP-N-acetylglucosamine diphosphorylase/glucosamine-1-phosphate N-acetyltransferase GlmU [Chloroflexota bacterium]|nr:bifunctional UDP-N-acetylglucosamine diphosphorylase/glucosamine-1-phosphate N-acetyltransferase GlmU [Chloroflexota bacterium]